MSCRTACPAARTPSSSPGWASPATASRPLKLPEGFDYQALFHGVDERVPVEALHFGVRVLDRFLRTA